MSNMAIWNAVEKTDPNYTKPFDRAGFKGTATNPTWLAKQATSKFGPIGIGWGINVIDEKYQEGAPGTIVHIVRCRLWYIWEGKTGEVEVYGQTTFSGKRNNGNSYTDEEAPKKSLTDAMTKALSLLGFAADVHLGLYDDNKYVNDLRREYREAEADAERPARRAQTEVNGSPVTVDNPKPQDDPAEVRMADNHDDIQLLREELMDRIEKAADEKALTKLMTSAEVRKKLAALPSDIKDEVRDYSIDVLNELNAKKKAG